MIPAMLKAAEAIREEGEGVSEQEELALELFIGDNCNQPRESSIADWDYFHAEGKFHGRIEHYKAMAAHALAVGYRKATK